MITNQQRPPNPRSLFHQPKNTYRPTYQINTQQIFDMAYVFKQPRIQGRVTDRKSQREHGRSYYKHTKTSIHNNTTTSQPYREQNCLIKIQLVPNNAQMQTTQLGFNHQLIRETIHSRKCQPQNRSHTSRSSQKRIEPSNNMTNSFLIAQSYRPTQSLETKRSKRIRCSNKKMSNISGRHQNISKYVSVSQDQVKRYCQKQMDFMRNSIVFGNKQTIKIYRPWSPSSDQEELNSWA